MSWFSIDCERGSVGLQVVRVEILLGDVSHREDFDCVLNDPIQDVMGLLAADAVEVFADFEINVVRFMRQRSGFVARESIRFRTPSCHR